ncbi:ABC transporter permease subunit [Staphylococcus carnosus]|uniref:ABC transporter, permease protein n=1 Tax=Staphylococcus carnosus (strain TM300) TaxID=396513 RepID=B9DPI2_STACT|nr:ABC transporter permease subunit [Staphylococcus carnosus]QPT03941.1 ABC transporter permease subunit [Staphylococcus carnosus]UQA66666.1 ABC transporter permease subunit [Staphylococcus carnosus]UTB78504.1 iron ABC transporter permease [Staphylococcus carnosus]UTB88053.1 iron ABC transporter permease [Staphylococcus carnosus]UTB90404.1 iron ABC transporter permease [Staphylococcus carnosus]
MAHKLWSQRIIQILLFVFFIVFLVLPVIVLLGRSIIADGHISNLYFKEVLSNPDVTTALMRSLKLSLLTAIITSILAFFAAYALQTTAIQQWLKSYSNGMMVLPMLVPTITYVFLLMYLFGNEGIIAKLIGQPLFTIYGEHGMLIGYVIYTLPAAFIIINNAFQYIDQRFYYISQLMQDSGVRRFYHTILRPMFIPIGNAFVLSFILSFTDFGIPASIGADDTMISILLYQTILGSIPKFAQGAVIAFVMLIPALFGFVFLAVIERWNVSHQAAGHHQPEKRPVHNFVISILLFVLCTCILSIFLVMIVVPFTENYPYKMGFTLKHIVALFKDEILIHVYIQSVFVAVCTALFGTIIAFFSAVINSRTKLKGRKAINLIAMLTNTVPGMILGLSYLLFFQGSSLKGTFLIVILSIIVHYFTTPYLMAKGAMDKLDKSWDITSALLQDNWFETLFKIILPNMKSTIIEIVNYYFINAMVTISGVIFLVSTSTQIVSTQINQLQHFNRFTDIFILSILILITNLAVRLISTIWMRYEKRREMS